MARSFRKARRLLRAVVANNRTSPIDVNTFMDEDDVDVWQAGLSFTYTPGGRQAAQ